MSTHCESLRNIARAEDRQTIVAALDETCFRQRFHRDFLRIDTSQVLDIHDRDAATGPCLEAALRDTAIERHLAAFEAGATGSAGAGELALVALTGCRAE